MAGDTNRYRDIFIKNLATGDIQRVSTAADGTQADFNSYDPALSPDGTKIAFTSTADNLVSGDTNGSEDIFVKDLTTGAVQRISTAADGTQADGDSLTPVFSPDGTKIAFTSTADNLVPGDTNGAADIFVKDLTTGKVTRVSTAANGTQGNKNSQTPVFSPDGNKIAFTSSAANLVPGDSNQTNDIFVKDLTTGAVQRVSTAADGTQGNATSSDPVFSPDGTEIAFLSNSSNLVPGDTNGANDIFVKDLTTGKITRVSTAGDGTQADFQGSNAGITFSPDGKIAFSASATNLVPNDNNNHADVFIKDLTLGVYGTGSGTDTAPVAVSDSYTTKEDTPLTIAAAAGVLANDTDAEGDKLTAALVAGPAHGALTLNTDGSFTYTPDTSYVGADAFTYEANDGTKQSPAATVSLSITASDHAPVAVDDSFSVPHGTGIAGSVLTNDTDPEGDPLTAVLKTGVTHGSLDLRTDGTFTYTPDAGFVGADSFTYVANDGTLSSNVATVTISVTDQKPLAVDDSFSVPHGTGIAGSVLTNDTDPDGDPLTAVLKTGVTHGSLDLRTDGTFTYTPDAGFVGADSFTYVANDGTLSSDVATVTISVTDQKPLAVDDSFSVPHGTGIAGSVLTNDTDPEGDPLTAVLKTDAKHGSLDLRTDGTFTYTPDAGFAGTDTFTYVANDGALTSNVATVTISVTDQKPLAADDSFSVPHGTGIAGSVLTNDTDPEGDPLTAVLKTGVTHGSLDLKTDGTFTYTPDAGFVGADSFTYVASDGALSSDVATVTISVTDQKPLAADDSFSVPHGTGIAGSVLTNDTDPEGDPLTAVLKTGVTHGSLDLKTDGTFTYTPDAGFVGADSFTYVASDGALTSDVATVTIKVGTGTGQPATPTFTLALSSLSAGAVPVLAGTAEAGATVTLYDGTTAIGTATADTVAGAYSIPGTGLGAGEHILTATATDSFGQTSAASSPLTVDVGTAATITAELDALETKPDLSAIVITDARLLPVASVAAMNHLITADASALAAIQGGYSFGITTATATGTVTSIYNPAGLLTFTSTTQPGASTTFDSFDAAGTLTREDVTAADKSQDITKYGITGQSYRTEQDTYNSAGVLTSQVRTHADGTLDSSYVLNPDGSKVLESFDASGTLTRQGTTYADKSQGVTKYGITGQSYTTEHDTYNSAGVLTSQVRTQANGTPVSSSVLNPDGSTVLDSFNAAGILTREGKTYADKSQDITKYSGTNPNLVTEHDIINAQGTQGLVDQAQTNGSHVEFIYGANQTLTSNTGVSDAFDNFSAGSTTFVFNPSFGQDTIAGFHAGAGANHDVIQIGSATLNQFSDLVSLMTPSGAGGADTLITIDPSDTILLKHVAKTTLSAQNFAFTHVA